MKWFKKKKKIVPYDYPIVQKIYQIPTDTIIGKTLGIKYNIPFIDYDVMSALAEAIYKFKEREIKTDTLSLICNMETRFNLELCYNKYIGIDLLYRIYDTFRFKQIIIDQRLHNNQIALENDVNMAMKHSMFNTFQGLYRYDIFLEGTPNGKRNK